MAHFDKLNNILIGHLDFNKRLRVKHGVSGLVTFSAIAKIVSDTTEKWEIDFLKERLLNDGYLAMGEFGDGEQMEITQNGIKFIQNGGYTEELKNRNLDKKIKEETLKKFQYDKWAFVISILSLVTALLSLLN